MTPNSKMYAELVKRAVQKQDDDNSFKVVCSLADDSRIRYYFQTFEPEAWERFLNWCISEEEGKDG